MKAIKQTILIIEDDAGLVELISEQIKNCSYQTACVQSAGKALDWLKDHTPLLMILDYGLPDMNGKDFIVELKTKKQPVPPFIVCTGQGDERIAVEMMKLGARDYIIKDNNFLEMIPLFVRKVAKVIENENQLKLAKNALTESTQYNKQIINSVQEGVIVCDLNLACLVWNPFMENLTGISASEVLGKYPTDLFPSLQDSGLNESLKKAIDESCNFEIEFPIELPAVGKSCWFSNTISPLLNVVGEVIGVITTIRDITERKKTEEELRNSEEKFRSITEQIDEYISISDKNGFISYASPILQSLFQYEPEQIFGHHFMEFIAEESLPMAIEAFRAGVENHEKAVNIELKLKRRDGSTFYGELNGTKVRFGNEDRILVVVRDVTARMQAKDALRKSEEKYRRIADNISDIVWSCDMQLNIQYLSPSGEKMIGIRAEEYISQPLDKKFTPQSIEKIYALLAQEQEKEKDPDCDKSRTLKIEVEHYRADGSIFWSEMHISFIRDENGKAIGLEGVTRDISKRKLMEQALQESEYRLRTIIDNEPECIKIVDANGILRMMNPAGLALIEADSQEQAIGMSVIDIIAPECQFEYMEAHKRVLKGESMQLEFEVIGFKGGHRWLETSAVPLQSEGEIVQLAIMRDITDRKQAEQELNEKMDELIRFHRLTVGRELTMIELKKEINELLKEAGKEAKYNIVG